MPPSFNVTPLWVQSLPATVQAGFPSPADNHAMTRLDLMEQLIKSLQAASIHWVRGDYIKEAGIDGLSAALGH